MSIGCVKALTERQMHVPDDVSLLVFDDSVALHAIGQNISVINRSATQMGVEAAKILIEKIQDKAKTREADSEENRSVAQTGTPRIGSIYRETLSHLATVQKIKHSADRKLFCRNIKSLYFNHPCNRSDHPPRRGSEIAGKQTSKC